MSLKWKHSEAVRFYTSISDVSLEISAFFPLRCCNASFMSFSRPIFAYGQQSSFIYQSWLIHLPVLLCKQQDVGKNCMKGSRFLFNMSSTFRQQCPEFPLKKLTSHLGDSGTRKRPTSCNRHGIVPETRYMRKLKNHTWSIWTDNYFSSLGST